MAGYIALVPLGYVLVWFSIVKVIKVGERSLGRGRGERGCSRLVCVILPQGLLPLFYQEKEIIINKIK